jgi:hypothetical protein
MEVVGFRCNPWRWYIGEEREIYMNRGRVGEEREVRKWTDIPLHSLDISWEYCVEHDLEMKQISELDNILVLPIGCDPGSITEDKLRVKFMSKNLTPLKFVCFPLELRTEILYKQNCIPTKTKRQFSDLLISWVSCVLSLYI